MYSHRPVEAHPLLEAMWYFQRRIYVFIEDSVSRAVDDRVSCERYDICLKRCACMPNSGMLDTTSQFPFEPVLDFRVNDANSTLIDKNVATSIELGVESSWTCTRFFSHN